MNRSRCTLAWAAWLALLQTAAPSAHGQEPEGPVKIVLHPAAEPTPALKYRLLPDRLSQIHGNAAVHYGKITAEETVFFGNRKTLDFIDEIREMPLEKLRSDNVRMPGGGPDGAVQDDIRRAVLYRYCDWQFPIGEVPYYSMPLPEAQQSRQFARILAAQARIQIAHGEFDDAVESMQAGFAMGQHLATGETLVNGLIGIAISGTMTEQLLDYVQQPKAPNLYWALTLLPSPLIDMSDALDLEADAIELSFPEVRDVRTANRTPEEWRELFQRLASDINKQTANDESQPMPTPEELDKRCHKILPAAKQVLIAGGLPADEVETMALHQVALLYTLATYRELADEMIKYFYLPYPQAKSGFESVMEHANQEQREIIPVAARLLPALLACRGAIARIDRDIAVLRILEAQRIYAAAHEGRLSERLDEITEVPLPDDPVTNQPFRYVREGEKARLEGPSHRDVPLNYEIVMVGSD